MAIAYQHDPVLAAEAIAFLNPGPGKTFVDATLGGGGHAKALLSSPLSPPTADSFPSPLKMERGAEDEGRGGVRIIGFDQDAEALEAAKKTLAAFDDITYVHDNFAHLKDRIKEKIDGILFDLGVSSYQLDEGERGFSLQHDGPLDMRMDRGLKLTAGDIVNNWPAEELAGIFFEYGEERFAKRIAKAIDNVRSRKSNVQSQIETTFELKEIVEKAIPTWKKRESVTRVFQALRIAVNDELNSLTSSLGQAIGLLKPGGRLAVISYHSLEDRIVKQMFREAAKNGILKTLTKKPVLASPEEITANPRARSAKLRAAEKL